MQRKMMDRLVTWKDEAGRKPLLLKGVRQVGKTHLLKTFGNTHFRKCHYLNFEKEPELATIFQENLVPSRILDQLAFFLNTSIEKGKDLVIFDEIQECPKALTSLKYFQEECPSLHLCAAGSLLGLHLNEGSFPVGKVTFETLLPLSFEEFLLATHDKSYPVFTEFSQEKKLSSLEHAHLWTQLKHYFIVGGLPEVVLTYIKSKDDLFLAFSLVRKKQEDLLQAYYADIAKHSGKANAMHIDRIFKSIPSQMNQTNDTSINRFKFKGVVPGITHYSRLVHAIDWLESTGLAIKVSIANSAKLPFTAYTKENLFKLLLFDVGILGSMCNLPPQTILNADYGSYKGYFAENFVAQELIAKGIHGLFCWQEGESEIEFLIEHNAEILPIEVKSGVTTKAKSLQIYTQKYAPPFRVIFSANPLKITSNTHHYPLYLAGKLP